MEAPGYAMYTVRPKKNGSPQMNGSPKSGGVAPSVLNTMLVGLAELSVSAFATVKATFALPTPPAPPTVALRFSGWAGQ